MTSINQETIDNLTLSTQQHTNDDQTKGVSALIILDVLSLMIAVVEIISIWILRKCVLSTEQIKFILKNLLLADICFHITNVLMPVTLTDFDRSAVILSLARLKLDVLYVFALIYCVFMVIATLDRLISIKYTVKYGLIFPAGRVRKLVYVTWVIAVVCLLIPIISSVIVKCFTMHDSCHIDLGWSRLVRMIIAVILLVCDVVVIICYFYILLIAKYQIRKLRHQYPALHMRKTLPAKRIMTIVGAFVLLYSPFVIFALINDIVGVRLSVQVFAVFYVFGIRIFNSCHSCISMYYYLYSMPECRMIFLRTFLYRIERCRRRQEIMKVNIYNIHVIQR